MSPNFFQGRYRMMDEGYVKYTCCHSNGAAPEHPGLVGLDELRTQLFDAGLVGQLESGVGFGNLSLRDGEGGFIVSATGTGGVRSLGADGYCRVTECDVDGNSVTSCGPLQASSESMSHAAVYGASSSVRYVVHIHSQKMFEALKEAGALATAPGAAFGTPDMARSIAELVRSHPVEGVIVMTGHPDGILAYGPTQDSVVSLLTFLQNNYGACPCKGKCHE